MQVLKNLVHLKATILLDYIKSLIFCHYEESLLRFAKSIPILLYTFVTPLHRKLEDEALSVRDVRNLRCQQEHQRLSISQPPPSPCRFALTECYLQAYGQKKNTG